MQCSCRNIHTRHPALSTHTPRRSRTDDLRFSSFSWTTGKSDRSVSVVEYNWMVPHPEMNTLSDPAMDSMRRLSLGSMLWRRWLWWLINYYWVLRLVKRHHWHSIATPLKSCVVSFYFSYCHYLTWSAIVSTKCWCYSCTEKYFGCCCCWLSRSQRSSYRRKMWIPKKPKRKKSASWNVELQCAMCSLYIYIFLNSLRVSHHAVY